MPKEKLKHKRKNKRNLSKNKLERDFLFHTTRQEVFWSELLNTAYSLDLERVKRKAHYGYVA